MLVSLHHHQKAYFVHTVSLVVAKRMWRRSLAVASLSSAAAFTASTSSRRTVAVLAHPGCLLCTAISSSAYPSSSTAAFAARPFSSTPLTSRGKQGRGSAGKFNNSKGGKPDHFSKGKFQRFSKGPVKAADFSIPEPRTAQEVGRKLVEKLSALSLDPELPSQLVAYGIKGKPAQLLLQHHTQSQALTSGATARLERQNDAATAIRLFRAWSEDAKDAIPDLAVLLDSGKEAKNDVFGDLPDALSSFGIEGDECLGRFCVSGFLDWVDRGLSALLSINSSTLSAADQGQVSLARSQLNLLRNTMDLRRPYHQYTRGRTLIRNIHLHVGPTNSGKTHGALVALSKARTGIFAGPLRLLAHEVWDRFNSGTVSPGVPARACNLMTGEEQRTVDPLAGLVSCTVEMVSTMSTVDVGVVDEIQMIGDPQRGFAWTNVVLGLPAKELHLCGEASVIPLIENLAKACGDHLTVHRYERLTPLSVAEESLDDDLGKIEKGDCIVAFSRTAIFALKKDIEKRTGLRCAVAYGALPPETKAEQAKLFNEGKLDVMVASDAIGMGLNLGIKRIVFDTLTKWNGKEEITLSASQIKQIAGRAGRYGTQDKSTKKADLGGVVTTRHEHELEILRSALASPLLPITRAAIQPNSGTLSSLSAMLPGVGSSGGLRTLSQIFTDVALLSRIDSGNFFMSDFSQQLTISPLIESASSGLLTLEERETFSNSPANRRDERLIAFLCNIVRQFSRGGLVDFDTAAKDLAMLEVEDEVVTLMRQAIAAREQDAQPTKEGKEELPLIAYLNNVSGALTQGSSAHPLINVTTLLMLESLHRCFTLYLWLSFRFPLAFCWRKEVNERKKKAEEAIDFVLQGIRFGRAKRLQALGRAPERMKSSPTRFGADRSRFQ